MTSESAAILPRNLPKEKQQILDVLHFLAVHHSRIQSRSVDMVTASRLMGRYRTQVLLTPPESGVGVDLRSAPTRMVNEKCTAVNSGQTVG